MIRLPAFKTEQPPSSGPPGHPRVFLRLSVYISDAYCMYSWIALATIDDLSKIAARVGSEYGPDQAAEMLSGSMSSAVKGVLIEHNYVDKDYRSTYYNYYAKKGQYYPARLRQVAFLRRDRIV